MSSAAASPVRTSALRARARELKASAAAYGQSTPELLASYDPATSSWRTSQRCLVEGWTVFSETWPRSGLMRSGTAYQLPPLVRLTDETDCGLWRTPFLTLYPAGLTDWEMEEISNDHSSTIRTRRAELVEMGLVRTAGTRKIKGRNRIVWKLSHQDTSRVPF
jgi:hypothetical protein